MLTMLNEIKSHLTEHFSATPTISDETRSSSQSNLINVDLRNSADGTRHSLCDGVDVRSKLLEMLNEVIRLCNLELEQQVVMRTRAKYLDAKFANYEYDMAAVMNQTMKAV